MTLSGLTIRGDLAVPVSGIVLGPRITVAPGKLVTLTGTNTLRTGLVTLGGNWKNTGTLVHSSTVNAVYDTLDNQGTISITSLSSVIQGNGIILNSGTIEKTGSGVGEIRGNVQNTGTVHVNSGNSLNFGRIFGGGDQTGSFIADTGGSIAFGGTLNLNAGTTLAGAFSINAGTTNLNFDYTSPSFSLTGGTLGGTGILTLTGNQSWTAGGIAVGGRAINTGTLDLAGNLTVNGTLTNAVTATMTTTFRRSR